RSAGMVSPKLVEKLSGLMALVYLIPWMFISKLEIKKNNEKQFITSHNQSLQRTVPPLSLWVIC
ncbi:MAG: hypothetical protein P9L97_04240, partial [Candidatus Tenebribacter davisii]|nr:hypothetical protein [Candidatus Tenebribacter davisii]